MKWYLAGKMSGIPQHNIPAFDAAAAELRAKGHEITSPAELDDPAIRTAALDDMSGSLNLIGESWGNVLARDVHLVADAVDGIVFLPAWDTSRGARLEAYVGLLCGKQFAYYDRGSPTGLYPITSNSIRQTLKRNMP